MNIRTTSSFDLELESHGWKQWFTGCTIGKCQPEIRALLAAKGRANVRRWGRIYEAEETCAELYEEERAWLLLETHMLAKGKHYKNWLRIVADSDHRRSVESRIKVLNFNINHHLFKVVVRQWIVSEEGRLRRESDGRKRNMISEPSSAEEGLDNFDQAALEESDVLPDPCDQADESEMVDKVSATGEDLANLMNRTTHVAMAAKLAGVSLANSKVGEMAGLKHAAINDSLKKLGRRVRECLVRRYPESAGDEFCLRRMLSLAMLYLTDINAKWLCRPENADLLRFLKEEGKLNHEAF